MRHERASFITPGHVRAFQAVTSQLYDNVTLTSFRINDETGVAIVIVDHVGKDKVAVMPLFVAITVGMEIEFAAFETDTHKISLIRLRPARANYLRRGADLYAALTLRRA